MIIDDDAALLSFTSKYLARLGYSITAYRNGEQAWQEFLSSEENYGLVMIDLSLAGLPGEKLSEMMLKADPDVRLILTSGYPFDTRKLSEAGPNRTAFLHKPFTPSMLAETVKRLIPQKSANHAD